MLASPPNCSLGGKNMKRGVKRRPLKLLGMGDVGSLRRHPFVVMNRFYLDLSSDIRLMPSLFCWHKDHKDSAQEKKKRHAWMSKLKRRPGAMTQTFLPMQRRRRLFEQCVCVHVCGGDQVSLTPSALAVRRLDLNRTVHLERQGRGE